jgi:hypothetical protein
VRAKPAIRVMASTVRLSMVVPFGYGFASPR